MDNKNLKTFLILSQFFWPEHFRINELANVLKKDYKVEVITSIPNYPEGKFFSGYSLSQNRNENYNDIKIKRILTYPRKNGNSLNLFINYLIFNIFSLIELYRYKKKIDLIFVPATSPMTQALAAVIIKKKIKCKIIIWIQDIYPESFYLKKQFLKKFSFLFNSLGKFILRNCDQIYLQNSEMKKYVERYVSKEKYLFHLPNWTEDNFIKEKKSIINNSCDIVMAGNIGEAQGIDELIDVLPRLNELIKNNKKEFKIHIIGTGVKKTSLIDNVEKYDLKKNIIFYGRLSPEDTSEIFKKCNFGLSIYSINHNFLKDLIPSRFISYVASNLIVLTNTYGAQKNLLNHYSCGFANQNIFELFKYAINISDKELSDNILNTKRLFLRNYDKEAIFNNFSKSLNGLLG
ncbi:MAG: glycosyltransferase family 4 protein [Alphaproteobacteria bacterium]